MLPPEDQEYLEKHELNTLFKELMGDLLLNKPDEPLRHLYHAVRNRIKDKQVWVHHAAVR